MIKRIILDKPKKLKELEETEQAFIVAQDGYYIKKTNRLFDAQIKIPSLKKLLPLDQYINLKLISFPERLLKDSYNFFLDVYKYNKSEALVLIYYNFDEKIYKLVIPNQTVSAVSIDYDFPQNIENNFYLVGTIHSHPNMPAFQSSTDYEDEKYINGIHITCSFVYHDTFPHEPNYHARLSIHGQMFDFDLSNFISAKDKTSHISIEPNYKFHE